MSDVLLNAALEYAKRGWFVFPCRPRTKEPAIARGFYNATTNPETIKRYWSRPDRNVGIRTGVPSGFWVLDIDGDDGAASLRALEVKHGRLPATREVITARGRHLWFRCTREVKSTTSKIAPGMIRGGTAHTCSRRRLFIRAVTSMRGRPILNLPLRPTGS